MRLSTAALVLAPLAAACAQDELPPRPQLLVVLDTDAPVLEQASSDPTIQVPVAVDTVRIDLLDGSDGVTVFREFSATSALDWPISFAVVPSDAPGATVARLRIRLFRARTAAPDIQRGLSTLAPDPAQTIDRVVEIPLSTSGVDARTVFLPAACLGWPASFRDRTSCVGDANARGAFAQPLPTSTTERPRGTGSVGSWSRSRAVPCTTTPGADRMCIPGGISVLGTKRVAGYEDGLVQQTTLPERLVELSAFHMDRFEYTVGRARKWLGQLEVQPTKKQPPDDPRALDYCTLDDTAQADALPLVCLTQATARQLCQLEGGDLPTEAQWNHAATGRGDGRLYPWGDAPPDCCTLSASRRQRIFFGTNLCDGEGPEAVGSHPGPCPGPVDVSRDGVVDLGGSAAEMLRDQAQPFDDACWGDAFGVLRDPICEKVTGAAIGARGANWSAGPDNAANGFRLRSSPGPTLGFRCVYPDGAGAR